MDAGVARQFGMEGRHEDVALSAQHGPPLHLGEHLDGRTDPLDQGRPDEDAVERALEAVDLESVSKEST